MIDFIFLLCAVGVAALYTAFAYQYVAQFARRFDEAELARRNKKR